MDAITHISTEVWYYLVVIGGYFQGSFVAAFAAVALFATPTRFRVRVWSQFVKFTTFNIALLTTGTVACAVWAAVAYPRWYVEADAVVSYQPLFPFGQWVLDSTFGSFHGGLRNNASLAQLQALWWSLTVGVWLSAVLLNRILVRHSAGIRAALEIDAKTAA